MMNGRLNEKQKCQRRVVKPFGQYAISINIRLLRNKENLTSTSLMIFVIIYDVRVIVFELARTN